MDNIPFRNLFPFLLISCQVSKRKFWTFYLTSIANVLGKYAWEFSRKSTRTEGIKNLGQSAYNILRFDVSINKMYGS